MHNLEYYEVIIEKILGTGEIPYWSKLEIEYKGIIGKIPYHREGEPWGKYRQGYPWSGRGRPQREGELWGKYRQSYPLK